MAIPLVICLREAYPLIEISYTWQIIEVHMLHKLIPTNAHMIFISAALYCSNTNLAVVLYVYTFFNGIQYKRGSFYCEWVQRKGTFTQMATQDTM